MTKINRNTIKKTEKLIEFDKTNSGHKISYCPHENWSKGTKHG